jgi:cytochrome c oxidase cbb3-type subunit 4
MLRFISGNLTTIDGVNIYPIFSLVVFVVFFTVMIYRVVRMKKNYIDEMGQMPIEDNLETNDVHAVDSKN